MGFKLHVQGNSLSISADNSALLKRVPILATTLTDSLGVPLDMGGGIPNPKFLREVGGSREMNVNGSVTNVPFYIRPAAGIVFHITSLTIQIVDSGVDPTLFGGLPALANGIQLLVQREVSPGVYVTILDILDTHPITRNANFELNGSANTTQSAGNTDDVITYTALMEQLIGRDARLDGDENDRVAIIVRDDLTGLTSFRAKANGEYYIKGTVLA